MYIATEYKITDEEIKETGKILYYGGRDIDEAVASCLYTARLSDGNAWKSPVFPCVYSPSKGIGWSLVPERKDA